MNYFKKNILERFTLLGQGLVGEPLRRYTKMCGQPDHQKAAETDYRYAGKNPGDLTPKEWHKLVTSSKDFEEPTRSHQSTSEETGDYIPEEEYVDDKKKKGDADDDIDRATAAEEAQWRETIYPVTGKHKAKKRIKDVNTEIVGDIMGSTFGSPHHSSNHEHRIGINPHYDRHGRITDYF